MGNVTAITDTLATQTQKFGYDERDRLTSAYTVGGNIGISYNQSYSYDKLGNFLTKAGVSYSYANGHPHQASTIGGQAYTYNLNGNLTSGGGRSYIWNADNQPTSIGSSSYSYDADNERVSSTTGGVSSYFLGGGLWEEDSSTANTRVLYSFGGQIVAQRTYAPAPPPPPTPTNTSLPTNTPLVER